MNRRGEFLSDVRVPDDVVTDTDSAGWLGVGPEAERFEARYALTSDLALWWPWSAGPPRI